ncbi:hypothetical protein [Nocardia otitidiscaviarum]|uniref:hypothetical protein n=1 Tax=Nocardia otitidiscaviarum TaxID=1823 RepID=UPI0004A6CC8D|nr:hypothetical protein [Nocardia otitidiscaviarum]
MTGAEFSVVRGKALRLTKANRCGMPIEGEGNYAVSKGFVTVTLNPVLKDAEELEQQNADGEICASDRTAPEIKWWEAQVEFCGVNTCLWSMLGGWPQVLDYAGNPVGFETTRKVVTDSGVVLELWSGTSSEDACVTPTNDDVFSQSEETTGDMFGYFLLGVKEWQLSGGLEIGRQVSTFTLSGITYDIRGWGRGPYNVVPIDASLTPGRLIVPVGSLVDGVSDMHMETTPISPPAPTDGCCTLGVQSIFTAPDYYYGGPSGEDAADVAPSQPSCDAVLPGS